MPETIMLMRLLFLAGSLILLTSCASSEPFVMKPLREDDPKGLKLPRGVPRGVDSEGNVVSLDYRFTTPEYERAAIQLVLQEANRVAEDMRFDDEVLPITETNVIHVRVSPFGFSYKFNVLGGVVYTSNYIYKIGRANKFSGLVVANYDQTCLKLNKALVPLEQMDTNAAFQLATQWLTVAGVDVPRLNRECKAQVAVSPHWSGLGKLGNAPTRDFAPIYFVWWTPYDDRVKFGGASVELFLPTKKLLQLDVRESKYVLRNPVVFTNLDSFFPGTGRVTVFPKKALGPVYYRLDHNGP